MHARSLLDRERCDGLGRAPASGARRQRSFCSPRAITPALVGGVLRYFSFDRSLQHRWGRPAVACLFGCPIRFTAQLGYQIIGRNRKPDSFKGTVFRWDNTPLPLRSIGTGIRTVVGGWSLRRICRQRICLERQFWPSPGISSSARGWGNRFLTFLFRLW